MLLTSLAGTPDTERAPAGRAAREETAGDARNLLRLIGDNAAGGVRYGWFGGHVFAVRGDLRPLDRLLGVEGIIVIRSMRDSEGRVWLHGREFAFYKDAHTDMILDRWHNPLNDARCAVEHFYAADARVRLTPGAGLASADRLRWMEIGGKTLVSIERHDQAPAAPPQLAQRRSFIVQFVADTADFNCANRTAVHFTGSWQRLSAWQPWMQMDGPGSAGYLFERVFTRKFAAFEELPARLVDAAAERFPEAFENPGRP